MEQNGRESGHVGKNKCIERTEKLMMTQARRYQKQKEWELGLFYTFNNPIKKSQKIR